MSIFKEQEQTSPDVENKEGNAAPNGADLIVQKLMEIKRPDGTPKYTDPIVALEALKASQEYIQQLETENAAYVEKVKEVETLEDTIKRLSGNMNNNEKLNPQTKDEGGRSVEAAEELVAQILEKKLRERDAVSTAISNVQKVQDALIAKYGGEDKAIEVIKNRAKALGTTPEALEELSAQNPNLVLELFGSSANATPSPNAGTIRPGGLQPSVEPLKAPEQSLLSGPGATHKNQLDYFRQIKANVNKRLGVTE